MKREEQIIAILNKHNIYDKVGLFFNKPKKITKIIASEICILFASYPEPQIQEVSYEDIEKAYPCEVGQSVIMEKDKTYDDVRLANYYRRQGAKAYKDGLIKK